MVKQPVLFIFLWLLPHFFIFHNLSGQEYSWKYYSVSDGLPQTQIYCLYQDSKGYIWIGTKGGLSKFDGIEFKNYTTRDGLSFDFIAYVREDAEGTIFIGIRRGGINYLKDGEIREFDLESAQFDRYLILDRDGTVWLWHSSTGLSFYRNFVEVDHEFSNYLPDQSIVSITQDQERRRILVNLADGSSLLWDGENAISIPKNDKGIITMLSKYGQIYGYNSDAIYTYDNGEYDALVSLSNYSLVNCISLDEIYLTDQNTRSKLFLFNGSEIIPFHQPFNIIMSVLKDDENNLWVGTESGLWRLQSRGFENYLSKRENNFYTWLVTQDKHSNYLFGSFLHGLKKYDGKTFSKVPIDHMFKDNGYQFFYSGSYIDRSGNVFLGNSKGILKYDGKRYSWFYHEPMADAILYIYHDDVSDHIYAASAKNGLLEFDSIGHKTVHNDRQLRENTGLEICVVVDKFNRIWLSGKRGISVKENGKWRNLPDEKDSIPIGAISMLKDDRGNLWLGSNNGLYFYDYENLRQIASSAFGRQIGVLNITNNNELLIGSITGIGLMNLDDFYRDGTEYVRFFDVNNGFLGTECKHNSSYKDRDGNIWICTSDRVVKVIPDALGSNPNPPRVYIQSISITSEDIDSQPVIEYYNEGASEVFEADHDDLRFNYHGISQTAPQGVTYQTMLEGYDKSWSGLSSERYRAYTNLANGTYTFKVKAFNNDGVESVQSASVRFEILPDWHERLSVRLGGLLGLLGIAVLFGYLYNDHIRKRKLSAAQNERRIAKLQFKALRGLIDPHFTFNAINSIAAMVYKENRDEAYHYFTKFSKLIRSAFDTSDRTTRTIKEELTFVTDYLDIEKMRFKDRFSYEIDVERNVNGDWRIPKMVVQIYVENSIKHGLVNKETGGLIRVQMGLKDEQLRISIWDNGLGRKDITTKEKKTNGLGRGTIIMKEYFKLMNRFNDNKIRTETIDLQDASGNPCGTEVVVSIPLNFKFSI